jgi:adenosine deaminase CECR1
MYSQLRQSFTLQVLPLHFFMPHVGLTHQHSNSMSHEFYQIIVGAPTMSLYSWKQLARWSLDYSCLSPADIKAGHAILANDWRAFCRFVKKEYGPIVVDNEVDEAKVQEHEKYKWRKDRR